MEVTKLENRYDGRGKDSPAWWPSRYGADDELGSGNELTPDNVLAALKLPKSGEIIQLAHVLDSDVPAYPPRAWHQLILAHGTLDELVLAKDKSQASYLEENVTQTYQIGTHLDGLGHLGIDGRFYDGLHYRDIFSPTGLTRLGIEHARPWLSRGILLDVAGAVGKPMLEEGFVITVDHLEEASRRAGVEVRSGDAVLLHTGWSTLWKKDNQRYAALEPGIGWAAGHWLSDRRISLIGADNWCVEVWPPEKEGALLVVHQHLLAETGTYIMENVKTDELLARGAAEFLFVLSPVKTLGSTGSMVNPLAVL
jgi:kynurenine formamidase